MISRTVQKLLESAGQTGVYYLLRFPTGWRLYSFPSDAFGDIWHGEAWRKFCAPDLAESWASKLNVLASDLEKSLALYHKGMPRGRVDRAGIRDYTILHGEDYPVCQHSVEAAFELTDSRVTWNFDPHEKMNPEHRSEIERLLPCHETAKNSR